MNVQLPTEPGDLPLGKASRGLLDFFNRRGFFQPSRKMLANLRVADELKSLRVRRYAAGNQSANLIDPAGLDHGFHSLVDSLIELCARRREADLDDLIAFQPVPAAGVNLGNRLSREYAYFDGANDFLRVAWGNSPRGIAIEPREHPVQILRAMSFRPLAQAFAKFFGARGRIGKSLKQRAQIESGPCREHRNFSAAPQICEDFKRAATIFACGENFVRLDKVNKVMGNSALLDGGNLCGSYIEMS